MKFLIDESLPRAISIIFSRDGDEVTDVRDVGLHGADDEVIFRYARDHDAVLVTADLDFVAIVRHHKGLVGLIVLRFSSSITVMTMQMRVTELLKSIPFGDLGNHITIITPSHIRRRPL